MSLIKTFKIGLGRKGLTLKTISRRCMKKKTAVKKKEKHKNAIYRE